MLPRTAMADDEQTRRPQTWRGYAAGAEDEEVALDDERTVPDRAPVPAASHPQRPRTSPPPPLQAARGRRTPLVEIEVIHEHGPAPSLERPWRALEIWTRNRIYVLEPRLTCLEVVDRVSREVVDGHPFVGMRLVGGQHREGDEIELSYPFPRPGTEAVFERPEQGRKASFSHTSTVTRVILRLHIMTVAPNYVVPTWEEITGRFGDKRALT